MATSSAWTPEADRLGLRYVEAMDSGDLAGARAVRRECQGRPEMIAMLDELLDGMVEEGYEGLLVEDYRSIVDRGDTEEALRYRRELADHPDVLARFDDIERQRN